MASNLKVFVCEFITGGGLYSAPLPASLVREGQAMLNALLCDLLDTPGIEIITTRDPRLPPVTQPVTQYVLDSEQDVQRLWQYCIDMSDAVWAVAPESGGTLEALAAMAGPKWLGCTPEAIRIAASKRATAALLAVRGIAAVPTYGATEWQADRGGKWVAKPDDGVGCGDIRIFDDASELNSWLADGRMGSHVVQPWLSGEAASISMLCRSGEARLLSCNRQLIEVVDDTIRYRGSILNDMSVYWDAFAAMAARVAAALPGLAGYVGVDVMVHDGRLTVLEINPRLTTSYVGLRRAIGLNPAELVLDLHYNGQFVETERLQRDVVEVNLDE